MQELDDSLALQRQRAASAERIARRHAELLEQHFVSQIDADQKNADMLEQQSRLVELRRARTQLEREHQVNIVKSWRPPRSARVSVCRRSSGRRWPWLRSAPSISRVALL